MTYNVSSGTLDPTIPDDSFHSQESCISHNCVQARALAQLEQPCFPLEVSVLCLSQKFAFDCISLRNAIEQSGMYMSWQHPKHLHHGAEL